MTNINPKTKIAYGYISSNALDSDLVDELMYGSQAHDASYEAYVKELEETLDLDTDEGQATYDDTLDCYEADEPIIEGELDGVQYCTSWLGGALNFWIFESPVITDKARKASPCVPGAGIIDSLDGDIISYDVPADWRREEY